MGTLKLPAIQFSGSLGEDIRSDVHLKTALLYLAHLKALDEEVDAGKDSRLKLITLWSDIATTGKNPLYAQLLLTRSALKSDAIFDDPLGNYLSPTGLAAMAQSRKYEASEKYTASDQSNYYTEQATLDLLEYAPTISLDYDTLGQVQHLTLRGVLTDAQKAQVARLPLAGVLRRLLDSVQEKARDFTRIKGHLLALQGALGLTADEIDHILTDAGKSVDVELSVPHVSLLYRYGLFAKALKLSIRELISLKQLSGLDPFKPVSHDPVTNLEEDYPFTQTLRFVEVAEQVKESGLRIEDLDYLLRHRFDPVGKYRPNSEAKLTLLKTLAEGIRAIRAEHAVPDDPSTMGEEVLRLKLGLVLPADIVERFLAMMNGTAEVTATKVNVQSADQLNPTTFAHEPSIRQVSYNATREEQKLTFRGVLFDPQKEDLKERFPSPVLPDLLDDVQAQAQTFFAKYLLKQAPNVPPVSGFLDATDFELLLASMPPDLNEAQQQERVREQRTRLVQAFLPFLQQHLIRQFIVQTMTAQTGAAPALVEALLTDARLLGDTQPLLEALTATGERGISASFFASTDAAGAAQTSLVFADADTASKDKAGNPLKPAGANSARFEGYLEAPAPGAYRFYVRFDKTDAEAELRFEHLPEPFLSGVAANDGAEIDEYLELKPGVPYRFTLELRKLGGGEARLLVQGETLPKDSLARLLLYPQAAIERADHARILLSKALQLMQSLNLNEREVRYLRTHAAVFDGLDLSKMPVRESDDTADRAKTLFAQFLRLARYARLKRDLAGGTDGLIDIFETKVLDEVYPLIAELTRREEATVKAAAAALFTAPAFADELAMQRLWEALQVVERFGVPVASIAGWTQIVSAAATPDQRFATARDLKETIKAHFEPEAWQRVAQPIFDRLRQRQRDALVAHVMHQHGFTRMEQLYEYFLIDPGMEPVVQTSRIRLAISSVQLFIQRCLLNLEKQVHPSAINARQWEWMKRYRVWEANRKIFLFPENWLEPEFRDDKTHLFSELESNLLQGDVSSDLVEDAFLNYLKKLDELAWLDIVAMHLDDKADPALNTLHVIGRTYNEPHKYFYRRYAHQMWTPWEPVTTKIEGDHLAPVVWRDRLYLFWVTFQDKADPNAQDAGGNEESTIIDLKLSEVINSVRGIVNYKVVEAQLHWSEYLEGKWSTPESGGSTASLSTTVPLDFDRRKVGIHVSKAPYEDGEERGVKINLSFPFLKAFHLAGRNSIPEEDDWDVPEFTLHRNYRNLDDPDETPYPTRWRGHDYLRFVVQHPVPSGETGTVETGNVMSGWHMILEQVEQYTLLPPNGTARVWSEFTVPTAPLFYQDDLHTLFVEPTLTERTIKDWQHWVTPPPKADPEWVRPDEWEDLLKPMNPHPELPIAIDPIDPDSRFKVQPGQDWLVNPATGLLFEGELIGPGGRTGLAVLPSDEAAVALADGATPVNIHAGSDLALGSTVVATASNTLEQAGLTPVTGRLSVVGTSGLNSALAQNVDVISRSGFGTGNMGVGLIRR